MNHHHHLTPPLSSSISPPIDPVAFDDDDDNDDDDDDDAHNAILPVGALPSTSTSAASTPAPTPTTAAPPPRKLPTLLPAPSRHPAPGAIRPPPPTHNPPDASQLTPVTYISSTLPTSMLLSTLPAAPRRSPPPSAAGEDAKPAKMTRLTDFEKGQIAALWEEYHSITRIQRRLADWGKRRPYNTIKSFIDRWKQRNTYQNVPASGRPVKVGAEERRRIRQECAEREGWSWARLQKEVAPEISLRTLKRVVRGEYDKEDGDELLGGVEEGEEGGEGVKGKKRKLVGGKRQGGPRKKSVGGGSAVMGGGVVEMGIMGMGMGMGMTLPGHELSAVAAPVGNGPAMPMLGNQRY
jgi:transposase